LGPIGRAHVGPALLAITTDGGRSWRAVNAPGLPDAPDGYPKGIAGVRFAERRHDVETSRRAAYALALDWPNDTAVRISRFSGDRLVSIGPTLPVRGTWPQLVVRGRGVHVLASEHLWASDDAGRSWQRLTTRGRARTALAAWSASGLALACGSQPGWAEVSLTDATHGVAVPWTLNASVLAFTSDGGRRWTEVGFTSSAGAPLPASPPSP
jgi:hypothetical protein